MAISIGEQAPPFTLYSSEKKEVALGDYRGRNVVLLFFPLAFSRVCTAELCSMRDEIGLFNDLDAQILAVSVDSPYTLAKFKEEQRLNFTLLSDFNKNVSQAYGALYEVFGMGMKGVSKRSAFVIDKAGVVRYAEVLDNAGALPDFQKLKETLASLN